MGNRNVNESKKFKGKMTRVMEHQTPKPVCFDLRALISLFRFNQTHPTDDRIEDLGAPD